MDGPLSVEKALSYAADMLGHPRQRRYFDYALQVLAAEVRRLQKLIDEKPGVTNDRSNSGMGPNSDV